MPEITVIMPVYNTDEKYLRESVESILNQTYTDFEFIILNDGSTNNAEEVILSYKDKRIKYFANEINSGLSKTRNRLLELAQDASLLAFMDSDDISLPTRLEKQINFLNENKDVDILGTWFETFPDNRVIKHPKNDKEIKDFLLFVGSAIGNPTVMIRRAILDKYNVKYDEQDKTAEDYHLWLSLIDKAKFANLPEILLKYRCHDRNDSIINSEEQKKNTNQLKLKAQGSILKLNIENISKAMEKINQGQKIDSQNAVNSIYYLEDLIAKMPNSENKKYFIKEVISTYKSLIKHTQRNVQFLNILWNNKLNTLMKNSLYFKLKSTLRGW